MAPKLGNKNSLKHGLYSPQRKTLSGFGRQQLGAFRKSLIGRAREAFGDLTITKAALLHTAIEAQRLSVENRELKAKHAEKLTVEQTLAIDAAYLKALARRDDTLAALELDKPVDPWAILDSLPLAVPPAAPVGESEATPAPSDATAANESDDSSDSATIPAAAACNSTVGQILPNCSPAGGPTP